METMKIDQAIAEGYIVQVNTTDGDKAPGERYYLAESGDVTDTYVVEGYEASIDTDGNVTITTLLERIEEFAEYVSEKTGLEHTAASIITEGEWSVSWCEAGKDGSGKQTISCPECVYYWECEAIDEQCEAIAAAEKAERDKYKYQVIKDGERYTIGQWDKGYMGYITNDGICNYYFWGTEIEAQTAADALNNYEGEHWLGEHGYGNDRISEDEGFEDSDPDMYYLYKAFNAVDSSEEEQ